MSDPSAPALPNSPRRFLSTSAGYLAIPLAAAITAPILAQNLGVAERGELSAVTAPFLLFSVLATGGLPEATTHFVAGRRLTIGNVLRAEALAVTVLSLLAGGATLLLAPILAAKNADVEALLALSVAFLPPALLATLFRGLAGALGRWRLVNLERCLTAALRLGSIVVLALLGHLSVTTAAVSIFGSQAVALLVYLSLRGSTGTATRQVPFREVSAYAGRQWVGGVSGILLVRLDQVLIAPLAGVFQLGLYAVAVNVGDLLLVVNSAVRDISFAEQSRKADDLGLARSARMSFAISVLMGLILAATLPLWLAALFGAEFNSALAPAEVILLAAVLGVPGSIAGAGLAAHGQPGLRSISLVVAAAANIGAMLLLIPSFGAMGAAIATLLGNMLASNLNIWFLLRARARSGLRVGDFYAIRAADVREMVRVSKALAPTAGRAFSRFNRRSD